MRSSKTGSDARKMFSMRAATTFTVRTPNENLYMDCIMVLMSQQEEPLLDIQLGKNGILIRNPNKSRYIFRIKQTFKTQPLLAAPATFLGLRASSRSMESPLQPWVFVLLGTQKPLISNPAKNLGFHLFEH